MQLEYCELALKLAQNARVAKTEAINSIIEYRRHYSDHQTPSNAANHSQGLGEHAKQSRLDSAANPLHWQHNNLVCTQLHRQQNYIISRKLCRRKGTQKIVSTPHFPVTWNCITLLSTKSPLPVSLQSLSNATGSPRRHA
ncbi:hypothetical protein Vafri_7214 [Volvox africanus]|uniref:Uncharacterized protein n=1 Tax=Volvox africanus TaxID=51714 RepID=A0A8J4B0A6_9CHLO|nr:hypothetical protein Vafri_7214 [Volvox africanus]